MLHVHEIFLIGEQRCRVKTCHDDDGIFYYISWLKPTGHSELNVLDRESFLEFEFGSYSFNIIIHDTKRDTLEDLVNYRSTNPSDSPDFSSLEDLTKFVEELRNIVFLNRFKELILN